jgi:hypothetical protein
MYEDGWDVAVGGEDLRAENSDVIDFCNRVDGIMSLLFIDAPIGYAALLYGVASS